MCLVKEIKMADKDTTNDNVMCDQAFAYIQRIKNTYMTAVDNLLIGSNLESIRMMDDMKKILTAKTPENLEETLYYFISEATSKELGVARGYRTTISIAKLQNFLDSIQKAYEKQSRDMDAETLNQTIKQLEHELLNKEAEIRKLNKTINDLLDMARDFAATVKDKARITARQTKSNFKNATDTVWTLLQRRRQERENPEPVDVKKLQRVAWGAKEKYYE